MGEFSTSIETEQLEHEYTLWGETVTYRQISSSKNLKTGAVTETNTDTTITSDCLVSGLDQKTVNDSGGKFQIGDRMFRIKAADMPETPPVNTSRIVYSGSTYKIIHHDLSSGGNEYWIVGRKV